MVAVHSEPRPWDRVQGQTGKQNLVDAADSRI